MNTCISRSTCSDPTGFTVVATVCKFNMNFPTVIQDMSMSSTCLPLAFLIWFHGKRNSHCKAEAWTARCSHESQFQLSGTKQTSLNIAGSHIVPQTVCECRRENCNHHNNPPHSPTVIWQVLLQTLVLRRNVNLSHPSCIFLGVLASPSSWDFGCSLGKESKPQSSNFLFLFSVLNSLEPTENSAEFYLSFPQKHS